MSASLDAMFWKLIPAALKKLTSLVSLKLSTLRSPVDAYFDDVMVMADDAAVKANRLAMLGQLQSAFLQVADIGLLQPQQ